jgi:hypothetical protein
MFTVFSALTLLQWCVALIVIWLGATLVLEAWEVMRTAFLSITTDEGPIFTSRYALTIYVSAMCLIAIVVKVFLNQPAPDIVYKTF